MNEHRETAAARRRRRLLAAALPLALAGCGLFPREKKVEEPTLPEPPSLSSIVTYPVLRVPIARVISGSADLTPVRTTSLYFKESGRVQTLAVEPDQAVVRGAVLAQLDIGDLEHQLRLAELDREIARTTLEKMRGMGSNSLDIRIQDLVLQKHEETIAYLSARAEAATIRAPYDGVVTSVLVQVSDRVADYATVLVMSDPKVMELQMTVTQDQFAEIHRGQEAKVRAGDGSWLPVSIVQTTHRDPARDASVGRDEYLVHLSLPGKGIDFREASRVNAEIVLERKADALVIPLAGLREFQGRTYVRVLEGETRREADVRTGIRTETEVEIVEGLAEGALVIGR
jgi:macrolide-specific efflux system membrane fusion protein